MTSSRNPLRIVVLTAIFTAIFTVVSTLVVQWFENEQQSTADARDRERDASLAVLDAMSDYQVGLQQHFHAAVAGDQKGQSEALDLVQAAKTKVIPALDRLVMFGTITVIDSAEKANAALTQMAERLRSSASSTEAAQRLGEGRVETCKALTEFVIEARRRLGRPLQGAPDCLSVW